MTMWGGRFEGPTDERMARFNRSIGFDVRLYAADIEGSIAYAMALREAGLITGDEHADLVTGLARVRAEFDNGTFQVRAADEDIHTAVERRLGELIGAVAGKLHTGRSRNDQVATDLRLYLLAEIAHLDGALVDAQRAIVDQAQEQVDVVMPGYTHLQQAQPILFSHWLMAFFWKLQRDRERLEGVGRRTRVCPLGAGALAGNPFNIDRRLLAEALGLETPAPNSIDAVSDRDYVVEFLAWAALTQVHLSNLAEDLIIWSSREFAFLELDEAYTTGSSLMPQKKNPDSLELMRGKSGRIIGHLTGLLTVLKGLPTAYNKDLQEDKESLFDAVDTLKAELPIAAGLIRTLHVDAERMEDALDDAMLATDLADDLVRKGVPFRRAHHLVGQVVRRAEALGVSLGELSAREYRRIDPAFAEDVSRILDFKASVEARRSEGGTAPAAVLAQIERAKEILTGEA